MDSILLKHFRQLLTIAFLTISISSFAQLSGIKAIPGDYATVFDAVGDLNLQGVDVGGVTFQVAAGHVETGNLSPILVSGNPTSPILFQKDGAGDNPKIIAGPGIPNFPLDAVVSFSGADYVTFDSFTIEENPLNTPIDAVEFGFFLYRADPLNGCQHITIINCEINLGQTPGNRSGIASTGQVFPVILNINTTPIADFTGTHSY
nr:hypothetical protein [Bacteroidota bacterium]